MRASMACHWEEGDVVAQETYSNASVKHVPKAPAEMFFYHARILSSVFASHLPYGHSERQVVHSRVQFLHLVFSEPLLSPSLRPRFACLPNYCRSLLPRRLAHAFDQ